MIRWARFCALCLLFCCFGSSPTYAWSWPVEGTITDTFGTRGGRHFGIDVAAPVGTPVIACRAGIVTRSYYSASYGHVVFVLHDSGHESVYAHLSQRDVHEGARVSEGQTIGTVGNTGHSFGAHLHFELHNGRWDIHKSQAMNPLSVLNGAPHTVYVVRHGDTLSAIAAHFDTSVGALKNKNGLTSDLIHPDQELFVR
ncbi:MAG: peptidoglycan DD-metalloendopeptidase family protein [Bacilli bacterium]